jgi:glycosyltransferase involved in cell wall biosynthesis
MNCSHVLIISPERWNGQFVSKHHYAIALASSGCKVYFVNPPMSGLSECEIKKVTGYEGVFEVDAPQVASGLRFYPKLLRRLLEKRWLERLERKIGNVFSTIWLFENSRFFDMSFAGNRLKIYHQVDLNQDFQVKTAAKTADICFSTTDFICKRLQTCNSKVYKIHHGLSVVRDSPDLSVSMMKNFMSAKAHVGYIGNLDICYLDVPLLSGLVKNFPDVIFHFVGNYRRDERLYSACSDASNVIWWGQVKSGFIPEIINRCDILLVAYLAEAYREQLASPHKMMEYLASGKTIVATYTDEYKDKRHLLEMVDRTSDFPGVFGRVVEQLGLYNSAEKKTERIEYALAHSYDRQLDKIMNLLKEHGLDEKM